MIKHVLTFVSGRQESVLVDFISSGVRRIFQWGGSVTSHCDDVKHYVIYVITM